MVQENPTAQTPEGAPLPTPAAEAPPAPELGAAEPELTVAAEEGTPAPEAGEAAPEPTPWASIPDPYDVLELPEFKTILGPRDGRIEERLRQHYTQQFEGATKDWESTQAHQTINGLIGNLSARLEASDMEGGERMVARLEKFREPYMEAYRNQLQGAGGTATATQLFSLLMNSLDVRGQDELQTAASEPGSQWKDIIEKYGGLRQKGADDRAYEKLKKEWEAAGAAGQQVQQAKEGGPVGALAPGSPAGGRSEDEVLLDPATPIETVKEIQARRNRAGG